MAHPKYSLKQIAKTIDHSLLKPEMTRDEVKVGCEIAKKYDVASVCCKPADVKFCADLLKGTDVEIGTVVGFPHGSAATQTKVFETKQAIADGATEIDVVLNIGLLKSGLHKEVQDDIAAVVNAAYACVLKCSGDGELARVDEVKVREPGPFTLKYLIASLAVKKAVVRFNSKVLSQADLVISSIPPSPKDLPEPPTIETTWSKPFNFAIACAKADSSCDSFLKSIESNPTIFEHSFANDAESASSPPRR